jgi:transcriptional regulator with XRE-family HTH domain
MHFAENLKKLIKIRSISFKDLSRELNVSPSTIHGWINGVLPRNIFTIYRLACIFNISIEELCFNEKMKQIEKKKYIRPEIRLKIDGHEYCVILKKI